MTRAADDFAFIKRRLDELAAERDAALSTFRCEECDGTGWVQDAPLAVWSVCTHCNNPQGYPAP